MSGTEKMANAKIPLGETTHKKITDIFLYRKLDLGVSKNLIQQYVSPKWYVTEKNGSSKRCSFQVDNPRKISGFLLLRN
jgi:hypothetical protein